VCAYVYVCACYATYIFSLSHTDLQSTTPAATFRIHTHSYTHAPRNPRNHPHRSANLHLQDTTHFRIHTHPRAHAPTHPCTHTPPHPHTQNCSPSSAVNDTHVALLHTHPSMRSCTHAPTHAHTHAHRPAASHPQSTTPASATPPF